MNMTCAFFKKLKLASQKRQSFGITKHFHLGQTVICFSSITYFYCQHNSLSIRGNISSSPVDHCNSWGDLHQHEVARQNYSLGLYDMSDQSPG